MSVAGLHSVHVDRVAELDPLGDLVPSVREEAVDHMNEMLRCAVRDGRCHATLVVDGFSRAEWDEIDADVEPWTPWAKREHFKDRDGLVVATVTYMHDETEGSTR